ncbi:Beta-barrel assembly machine subunit BamD [Solimonas aquatica]|uniref:Outer membrane protein assembly factor BamD n=1 Tax=Solimonas aquatica TaxID=489703 RepID=A0A1H9CX81_9GAMM|nr:outer membrane protein assembly factor BamD [Solimonas aquatica]SEQ05820.1 Beta-barrel assembly machine subunit BamD [Solimonas aquatica]
MNYRIMAAAVLLIGLSACKSNPDKLPPGNPFKPDELGLREQKLQAAALYKSAREALDSSDFGTAAKRYETLATKFPFTDYAIQGQMEKVYAEYRAYQPDEALTDAEHFLRDYPRHPRADYVQYLKGLINFDRDRGLEASLGFSTDKRDVTNLRRSFDDFSTLVQKYPKSVYVGDARQRMIALRNQIARHEETIVDYYIRRGAWIAAAKRAEQIVAQYPGAPVIIESLAQLERAYQELGLKDQADDARRLRQAYELAEKNNKDQKAEAPAAPQLAAAPAVLATP